jgi:DHA1 family bicyclomycin/chloramphenicol resistance-like MFS transporter
MNGSPAQKMGTAEFVALVAMLFSTIAFSMDALLPAFPNIQADLNSGPSTHLLLSGFMGGLAVGTLVAGPMSDAFGRKAIMYLGAIIFIGAGLIAWLSDSFEVVVAARILQGVGAAGPRVVSLAIVRDLYEGRQMARIVSLAMVLFAIVPTVAPLMGDILADTFGWRSILLSFVVFSLVSILWFALRLYEPLPQEKRRPFRIPRLLASSREVLGHRTVRLAIMAQCAVFSGIFSLLMQVQPIYDQVFGRAETFPYWFGGIALVSAASTSLVNAALVVRFGMRRLVTLGMTGSFVSAAVALIVSLTWPEQSFVTFVVWQFLVIWLTGMSIGNLNAIALEPMGHIAGMAASWTGSISTLVASLVAAGVGYLFNGTDIPLLAASAVIAFVGVLIVWRLNAAENAASSPV